MRASSGHLSGHKTANPPEIPTGATRFYPGRCRARGGGATDHLEHPSHDNVREFEGLSGYGEAPCQRRHRLAYSNPTTGRSPRENPVKSAALQEDRRAGAWAWTCAPHPRVTPPPHAIRRGSWHGREDFPSPRQDCSRSERLSHSQAGAVQGRRRNLAVILGCLEQAGQHLSEFSAHDHIRQVIHFGWASVGDQDPCAGALGGGYDERRWVNGQAGANRQQQVAFSRSAVGALESRRF